MQTFISHCNDTLVPIAELVYDQVSSLIDSLFEENLNIYLNMEALLSNTSQQTPEVRPNIHFFELFKTVRIYFNWFQI